MVRLYVEYLIARPGKFSQLSDWTKVRDEKHLICGKVCDYLVQNLYLDDPEEFLTAMNVKYLEDFKPVFYSALFMIELIKLWQQIRRKNSQEFKERSAEKPSSVEFPCTIPQMIELSNECVMYPELRSKLHADIGRLEETIQLVISDYRTQTGTTNISASQLLNATQEPMFAHQFSLEGEDLVDENADTGNLNPSKHIYPLDDNLLFVLPFVALKLCGKALSSKDYIQLLSEHPQESLCQNILTEYEDLVDQLYPQFMSYKLSLQAPTLNLYQFRLVEFVFEDFQKLHTHFPQYYDPDDGAPQDESLLYPAGMYFRLLKKVWKDLTLPDTLLPIASNLLCGLVVANPEYVSQREELVCLGIAYFLLKAFYGLGLNFPSLTTIARGVAEAELVQDQEGVASFNRCLDFIEKFSSEHPDALVALSKRLPSFGSVVDIWCKTYELIRRKGDSASFYPQTVEDMAALTYPQMITLIEKTAPQLLHSTKKPRVKFLEKPKSKDRLSVTRKNPSTTTHIQVSYPSRPGAYVVKEEVKDEMAFILDCTTLDDSELDSVQLPLPADVFVKFKQLGSQPVSSIPEDVLIVFEVFTAWAGMDKERVMQTLEGTEKQILKLLR